MADIALALSDPNGVPKPLQQPQWRLPDRRCIGETAWFYGLETNAAKRRDIDAEWRDRKGDLIGTFKDHFRKVWDFRDVLAENLS